MTTLTQLVEHYCPNGVDYVKLGNVATYYRGLTYSKKNEIKSGGLKVLRANNVSLNTQRIDWNDVKTVELDKPVKPTCLLKQDDILMVANSGSKAHVGKIAYINQDFVDVAFGGFMATIRAKDTRSSRYIYHVLSSDEFKAYKDSVLSSATINNLKKSIVEEFKIPLPPREVQDAIVERLDAFAALIESLDSEITLREKRFEYFREQLLNLDESEGVDFVLVCDAFRAVKTPKGIKRSNYSSLGKYPVVDQGAELIAGYTDQELSIHGDYVVFGDHTRAVKWVDFPFVVGADGTKVLRAVDGILPKFSYHCMSNLQIENLGYSRHWKIVNSMQIPLPSLEVQQDIVDKLDTMQALIDNLKQERELRKAQFEYYREKLLTFNS